MSNIREYQGPGFFLTGGAVFDLARDAGQKPAHGQSRQDHAARPVPAKAAETALQAARRRSGLGLALSGDEQSAFDAEVNRKITAGVWLNAQEQARLIELMAAMPCMTN